MDEKKYITVKSGTDFRKIARIMTKHNYKMNHATARNQLISAMNNLLDKTAENMGMKLNRDKLADLIKDQNVHDSLTDVLYIAYCDYLKETKKGDK
jgi:cytidylate kinase